MSETRTNIPIFESRLKELREEYSFTQEKLIELLNQEKKNQIVLKTYQQYEQGRHAPKLQTLMDLADVYNVSVDYILKRSDCKSVDNEYISRETGLSDSAIDTLKALKYQMEK